MNQISNLISQFIDKVFIPFLPSIICLFFYDFIKQRKIKGKLEIETATFLDPYINANNEVINFPPIIWFKNQGNIPVFYEILPDTKLHNTSKINKIEPFLTQSHNMTGKILPHKRMFVEFPLIKTSTSEQTFEILFDIKIRYGKKENKLCYILTDQKKLIVSLEFTSTGLRHTVKELNLAT